MVPNREHALRLLRDCRAAGVYSAHALEGAIAYLETDPVEALAEDFAARMIERAVTIEKSADGFGAGRPLTQVDLVSRAAGLREAARMLRDRGNR